MKRIGTFIFLVISALFFPWWIALIFSIVASFAFSSFAEALLIGLLLDAVWGFERQSFFHFQYVFTLIFFMIFICSITLRSRIIFYKSKSL